MLLEEATQKPVRYEIKKRRTSCCWKKLPRSQFDMR
nr:MAG TPA: hypothetical protein [Caudoviricetes sp.]